MFFFFHQVGSGRVAFGDPASGRSPSHHASIADDRAYTNTWFLSFPTRVTRSVSSTYVTLAWASFFPPSAAPVSAANASDVGTTTPAFVL